ncbi:HAD-IA family hydrolase [Micromonospora sp. NPDC047707]|uniref:HAD-IA family hydrolase n=1 Tax=Micromonospora sp. NPDC047707 TaxID=3154498 RepID=UPI003455C892
MLGAAPAQCIVVEDAPAGVHAAHAAGMRCIGIGDGRRCRCGGSALRAGRGPAPRQCGIPPRRLAADLLCRQEPPGMSDRARKMSLLIPLERAPGETACLIRRRNARRAIQ